MTELFVNNPSIGQIANPNLRPEVSRGYDYGFEQPLFNDRLRFGATYFHNNITNLITTQFNPATFTFSYMNIGQAETHGVRGLRGGGAERPDGRFAAITPIPTRAI